MPPALREPETETAKFQPMPRCSSWVRCRVSAAIRAGRCGASARATSAASRPSASASTLSPRHATLASNSRAHGCHSAPHRTYGRTVAFCSASSPLSLGTQGRTAASCTPAAIEPKAARSACRVFVSAAESWRWFAEGLGPFAAAAAAQPHARRDGRD
eukprot:7383340-Prymnesium_polylepis.1